MKSHVGIPVEAPVEEYCVKPAWDEDGVQASSGIGVDGKEYPDPVPMAPPVGYNAPPDLMQLIRSMVRSEHLQRLADEQGFDTYEESDDFEVEDDPLDPLTPYEKVFEPPPTVAAPSPVPEVSPNTGAGEGAVASPPPVVDEKQHSTPT